MKFLLTYQQGPRSAPPTPENMAQIAAFTKKQHDAGVLIMTGGLVRPSRGIQLECKQGEVMVVDGPFAETKELIDGFALVELPSQEAAIQIAREFMKIAGDGTGEVLAVFDAPVT